ncbi:RING-type domain-containing protein [Mycena chlorophos]|uniref:RING-type domain-containing protein n=1 Tax=Mycena chlorophos TaxID=658473 RepID=A0A8H6TI11_MYCCL|nr:RING-type domain-containing protein [Mycena chlorophos]
MVYRASSTSLLHTTTTMATCAVCCERFTAPVSLPCGHVFCRDCIRNTVNAVASPALEHYCPSCRVAYAVVTVDTTLVPPYLRPHVLPPIRPLLLESKEAKQDSHVVESALPPPTSVDSACSESQSSSSSSDSSSFIPVSPAVSSPASVSSLRTSPDSLALHTMPPPTYTSSPEETSPAPPAPAPSFASLRRTAAEADALRMSCQTWRQRAEVHAAANAGLLSFARAARNAALRLRTERDDARRRVAVLERQLMEAMEMQARFQPASQPRAQVQTQATQGQRPKRLLPELLVNTETSRDTSPESVPIRTTQTRPVKRGPSLPNFVVQQRQAMRTVVAGWDAEPSLLGPPLKRRRLTPSPPPVEVA